MTAYIDNIIIQGTPEEIQDFLELRNQKEFGQGLIEGGDYTLCMKCCSAPCQCSTASMGMSATTNGNLEWKLP